MYKNIVIETFRAIGGGSKHAIRARPLDGQGFSTAMRVECSSAMREKYPIGTKFLVRAKIKETEQDAHIYTSWQWPYRVVSDEEAIEIIKCRKNT
jgi:hypothetical protein